ncbi:MAG: hypothetical protein AAF541_03780 [Pseudomonadota bacterium]
MKLAPTIVTALIIAVSAYFVFDRGGMIAWSTLLFGIALLVKMKLKPSASDLLLSLALATLPPIIAATTFSYVISTYESGEVVELTIPTQDTPHIARVWIFELDGGDWIYYDAPPAAAISLISGNPIQVERNKGQVTRTPQVRTADTLSEEEAARVFQAMADKYGDRMTAADIYYVVLGNPRDRVALIANLIEG